MSLGRVGENAGDEVARPATLSGRWVRAHFPEQRLVIEPKKSVSHVWNTKRCTNQCFHNCGMCCLLFLNRYLSSTTPNWSRLPKPIYRSDKGRVFNEWVSTWTSYLITKVCSDKLKERYITCNLAKFVPHVFGLFISWHVRTNLFERKVINTANTKRHRWEFFKDSSLLFETHVENMILGSCICLSEFLAWF